MFIQKRIPFLLLFFVSCLTAMEEDWCVVKSDADQGWALLNSNQSEAREVFFKAVHDYKKTSDEIIIASPAYQQLGFNNSLLSSLDYDEKTAHLNRPLKKMLVLAAYLKDTVDDNAAFEHLIKNMRYKDYLEGLVVYRKKITTGEQEPYALEVTPDGMVVASGHGRDIKVWHGGTETWQPISGGRGKCAAGDDYVALKDDNQIKLIKISPDGITKNNYFLKHLAYAFSFSPDGKHLASGKDDTIKLWDLNNKKCVHTFTIDLILAGGYYTFFPLVSFSANGKLLAYSVGTMIALLDVSSRKCLHTFLHCHEKIINSLSFSPDGRYLASSARDIKLWDLALKKEGGVLHGHNNDVNTISFSSDARYLASGSDDQTIKIWYIPTQQCLQTIRDYAKPVSLCFLPNGNQLMVASNNDEQPMKTTIATYNFYDLKRDFDLLKLVVWECCMFSKERNPGQKLSSELSQCALRLPGNLKERFNDILDSEVLKECSKK